MKWKLIKASIRTIKRLQSLQSKVGLNIFNIGNMQNRIPDNWYETFFSGINCEMWEKAATQQWTDAEVVFIKDILNVDAGASILDIPCGTGRHSIELAKQGFRLTSVDISAEFLDGLKKKVEEQQLAIEIIHGKYFVFAIKYNV